MQTLSTLLSQSDLRVLEEAILQYKRIVTFQDLVSLFEAKKTRDEIRTKVALLVKKGWLIRLKKGLYLVVTDISTLGSIDLSEYVIAQALHIDSYISFENALQYHGIFDQMLRTVGSVTATYAREHSIQNIAYTFSRIKQELHFGFTEEVFGQYTVHIAEKEKALLDMIYFRKDVYTVNVVLEKLREYKHRLDFEKLQHYATKYGIGMMRTIGFLLDQIGVDTTKLIMHVKKSRNSYNKLTKESKLFNAKWRLYYENNAII